MAFPTNPIYKLVSDTDPPVVRSWDNRTFVIDGEHRFAEEYKAWVDAGNTPEAAD